MEDDVASIVKLGEDSENLDEFMNLVLNFASKFEETIESLKRNNNNNNDDDDDNDDVSLYLQKVGRCFAANDFPQVLDGLWQPLLLQQSKGLQTIFSLLRLFSFSFPPSRLLSSSISSSSLLPLLFLLLESSVKILCDRNDDVDEPLRAACEDLELEEPGSEPARRLVRESSILLLSFCESDILMQLSLERSSDQILHLSRDYFKAKTNIEATLLYRLFVKIATEDKIIKFFIEKNSIDLKFFDFLQNGFMQRISGGTKLDNNSINCIRCPDNEETLEESLEIQFKMAAMTEFVSVARGATATAAFAFLAETILEFYPKIFGSAEDKRERTEALKGLWMVALIEEKLEEVKSCVEDLHLENMNWMSEMTTTTASIAAGLLFCLGLGKYHEKESQKSLKPEEKMMKERFQLIKECLDTEQTYISSLEIVVEYGKVIRSDPKLGLKMRQTLLGNLPAILKIHKGKILPEMEEAYSSLLEDHYDFFVCAEKLLKVFEENEKVMTEMYTKYVGNVSKAEELIKENRENLEKVKEEIKAKNENVTKVDSLNFYIQKPFQRITRYPLLFDKILKCTLKLGKREDRLMEMQTVLEDLVNISKKIPAKVNLSLNLDRIQNVTDRQRHNWGVVYDMSTFNCSNPKPATKAVEDFVLHKSEEEKVNHLIKGFGVVKKTGLIAEQAIVICQKQGKEENSAMKFEFEVRGNHNCKHRPLAAKEGDFRVLILYENPERKIKEAVLMQLPSETHFEVWQQQLQRMEDLNQIQINSLVDPVAASANWLEVMEPRLFLSSSQASFRASGEFRATMSEANMGSIDRLQRNQSHASFNFGSQTSVEKLINKPEFKFDVSILHDRRCVPVAMTLWDLLTKEGHRVWIDTSLSRLAERQDLDQSAAAISSSETIVSFLTSSLANLHRETEIKFATSTGKSLLLFRTNKNDLSPTMKVLREKNKNVCVPIDLILDEPTAVVNEAKNIFDLCKLKMFEKRHNKSPRCWTESQTRCWLMESRLQQLESILKTGKELHLLAEEWGRSPTTMRRWLAEEVERKVGEEEAKQLVERFASALYLLYPNVVV